MQEEYEELWREHHSKETGWVFILARYNGELSLFEGYLGDTEHMPDSFVDEVVGSIHGINTWILSKYPELREMLPEEYREKLLEQVVLASL